MVKKVLTIATGLMLALSASATINFSASDIQFWVGTGSNQAVVVIGWDDNPSNNNFALAWGVRWNGSAVAVNMLDSIATYDDRVSYNIGSGFVTFIGYNDGTLVSGSSASYWCYTVNGAFADAYSIQPIADGDIMEISSSCYFSLSSATAATNPSAGSTPEEATIAATDILYWVGTGANQVIMAVNWADTALAWGYRFDGSKTVGDMMTDIASADPRFRFVTGSYGIDDILFVENGDTLRGTSWWESSNNGVTDMGMGQTLANGDLEKWADPAAGVVVDSFYYDGWGWIYTYVYPMTIHPVSAPMPVEATIAADAIEYWVGTGANQVIMAVNWADTALAWGYRFDGSKTVGDMMTDIASADPRFRFVTGSYGIDDILFVENGDTLRGTSWWESSNNGVTDMGMGQTLANGDLEKWTDPAAGVVVDSFYYDGWGWIYTYVYPTTIHAVSQPFGYGPFSGIVDSEGCEAIAYSSSDIKAWATACTLVRGSQNLTNPDAPVVTYGAEQDAVGAASTNNMAVVSLGDGGTATLTFAHPITNGEGPDFAVFENSFDDYFLELAFVEVSSDGERFVRFPATSLTQTVRQIGGNGRVDATYINNLAGKYRAGYGTPFDLAELADSTGIDIYNITHVRIVDVVGSIDPQYATYDAFGHMVNDPFPTVSYSAGFDLDGVAVLHENSVEIADVDALRVNLWPNPATDRLTVSGAQGEEAILFDAMGHIIKAFTIGSTDYVLDLNSVPSGVYMLRIGADCHKVVKR